MSNIVTCPSCRTEYDGTRVEPGARFACVTCGNVVSVSINHNPNASHPASVADVAAAAQPELIRGAGSTFVTEPPRGTAPYMPASIAPQHEWSGGWEANSRPPKVRGYLWPILLTIAGPIAATILIAIVGLTPEAMAIATPLCSAYPIYWLYRLHSEHPRRRGVDGGGIKTVLPYWLMSAGGGVAASFALYETGWIDAMNQVFGVIGNPTRQNVAAMQANAEALATSADGLYLTTPGLVALGTTAIGMVLWCRMVSLLTGRLNALRASLPAGPFVPPKAVSTKVKNNFLWFAVACNAAYIGSTFFPTPVTGQFSSGHVAHSALSFVGFCTAVTTIVFAIIWWVQTQRLADGLASQAHFDAAPPVTNSYGPQQTHAPQPQAFAAPAPSQPAPPRNTPPRDPGSSSY